MKHMKRLVSLITAFLMVFGLSLNLHAADGDPTYSITINNATVGTTYTAYKLFDVTTETTGTGEDQKTTYAYTTSDEDYVNQLKTLDPLPFAFTKNGSLYYVSLNPEVSDAELIEWIQTNFETVFDGRQSTSATATSETVTIDLDTLGQGYYYVKTSTGTIAMIDTASPRVNIYDKNHTGFTKEAVDDPDKVAGVGEDVNFVVTGILYPNLGSYGVTDTMENMSFNNDLAVYNVTNGGNTPIDASNYEIRLTENGFTFTFNTSYLDGINSGAVEIEL